MLINGLARLHVERKHIININDELISYWPINDRSSLIAVWTHEKIMDQPVRYLILLLGCGSFLNSILCVLTIVFCRYYFPGTEMS